MNTAEQNADQNAHAPETAKAGDEKRQKRNNYARAYYAMHKDRIKANAKKSREKRKAAAKQA